MITPGELVDALEYELFKAEDNTGDWKFASDSDKERYRKTALYLVLKGWTFRP